jgi:hypothetical protein
MYAEDSHLQFKYFYVMMQIKYSELENKENITICLPCSVPQPTCPFPI